ncbi:MAG: hypothetical protein GX641_02870 [Mollicutes bacterium]|nr:hypothetical protein [Mollicutes bacterium]
MKNLKKILLVMILFLMVGCGSNAKLKENVEKMEISSEGINGYAVDLRIYGSTNNTRVNESLRIFNSGNKDYKIEKNIFDIDNFIQEITYIRDGEIYTKGKEDKYILSTSRVYYSKPHLYLEGVNNLKTVDKGSKVENQPNLTEYQVEFQDEVIEEILKDIEIVIPIEKNVKGKVQINKEGYVYRVIYQFETITVNALFYQINNVSNIDFPEEIIY